MSNLYQRDILLGYICLKKYIFALGNIFENILGIDSVYVAFLPLSSLYRVKQNSCVTFLIIKKKYIGGRKDREKTGHASSELANKATVMCSSGSQLGLPLNFVLARNKRMAQISPKTTHWQHEEHTYSFGKINLIKKCDMCQKYNGKLLLTTCEVHTAKYSGRSFDLRTE